MNNLLKTVHCNRTFRRSRMTFFTQYPRYDSLAHPIPSRVTHTQIQPPSSPKTAITYIHISLHLPLPLPIPISPPSPSHPDPQSAFGAIGGYRVPSFSTLGSQVHHDSLGSLSMTIGTCWPQPHHEDFSARRVGQLGCICSGMSGPGGASERRGDEERRGRTALVAGAAFAHFVCWGGWKGGGGGGGAVGRALLVAESGLGGFGERNGSCSTSLSFLGGWWYRSLLGNLPRAAIVDRSGTQVVGESGTKLLAMTREAAAAFSGGRLMNDCTLKRRVVL